MRPYPIPELKDDLLIACTAQRVGVHAIIKRAKRLGLSAGGLGINKVIYFLEELELAGVVDRVAGNRDGWTLTPEGDTAKAAAQKIRRDRPTGNLPPIESEVAA